jgi:diguanylate cyclase (GGDEF)-like protein
MQVSLIDAAAHLVQALGESAIAVALYDPHDTLVWANTNFDEMFLRGLQLPVPFADVLRHGFSNGFGVKIDSGNIEAFLADILSRRRSVAKRAFATDTVDGRWLWISETVTTDGWLLSVACDITALKQNEKRLERAHEDAVQAAMTDALTGASNRRHISALCEGHLQQLHMGDGLLSVALIDLDGFKQINDKHGHDVGDAVLRGFVNHFQVRSRGIDALGRWGGEEFLLLVPGATAEQAIRVVDRLRGWHDDAPGGPCTFSAGVAEAQHEDTVGTLLKRADNALYEAKRSGGGRCVVAARPV